MLSTLYKVFGALKDARDRQKTLLTCLEVYNDLDLKRQCQDQIDSLLKVQ